ncbi:ABC protein [Flagelloscypha sp. PMI_526]|nr:ABC protein [Flagelloscypha sp. PMI_526]
MTRISSEEPTSDHIQPHLLDYGQIKIRRRENWWQFWIPSGEPRPPQPCLDNAPISPLVNASFLSKLSYTWMNDIMVLGYRRTLQASDLPKLDPSQESARLSDKLDTVWTRRVLEAEEWNRRLRDGHIVPPVLLRFRWFLASFHAGPAERKRLEFEWRNVAGQKEASLTLSLHEVFKHFFWLGAVFRVLGDISQLGAPILLRAIINYAYSQYDAKANGMPRESLGKGVALALGLFFSTIFTSVCQHQFFWRCTLAGMLVRSALIGSLYKRGLSLSAESKTKIPNSLLVNYLSTDVSRVDLGVQWVHAIWTSTLQLLLCFVLLAVQLGPSAAVGFSIFFLMVPIQQWVMRFASRNRRTSAEFSDARASVLLEIFSSMRIVKFFTYESSFLKRIARIRKSELKGICTIQHALSLNIALAFSTPAIATTVSLITYATLNDNPNVGIMFSSVALFSLLRQPMMFLPRGLSSTADAISALQRLTTVFQAKPLTGNLVHVDVKSPLAVEVRKASFEWDNPVDEMESEGTSLREKSQYPCKLNGPLGKFQVKEVNISLERGKLAAVIGRVGSGKSSLMSGLIGEMRKTRGEVCYGGEIAYCAQTAWIQNATLRENVLFGSPFEEARYWAAIEAACLVPDLEQLPDGDLTEIGEKGINLSGGQKQRVNICRALYARPDVLLLDDPLSAVDSYVGKSLFNALLILRNQGTTIVLITHALHFLSQCDHIYAISNGRIVESGTYSELLAAGGETGALIKEFGGQEVDAEDMNEPSFSVTQVKQKSIECNAKGTGKLEGKLVVRESRETGHVSWTVYLAYFKAAKGRITMPVVLLASFLLQATSVMSNITLTWWKKDPFGWPFWGYEVLYGALTLTAMLMTFVLCFSIDIACDFASQNLHHSAIEHMIRAPMAFFDTTPTGRVMSVFGKDVDSLDNQLSVSIRFFIITFSGLFSGVILITIYEPYFIIAAIFILILYRYFGAFYQSSAREIKRLDSMLRSLLYAHFSESLTGVPTIRSYKAIPRFISHNCYFIDLENRALILIIASQRWLAVRVDTLGALLVLFVALMATAGPSNISAAEIGLILTYTILVTQASGTMTRQSAEVENNMNAVERLVHYSSAESVPQEAADRALENELPSTWPENGSIEFQNVEMRYRPGLPLVLNGISVTIQGGQRIGICGRTGSGKSSLTLALLRIAEFSGLIKVDGVDISKIGLFDLRSRISIIPQDPILFSGTVRESLDPFSAHDDAKLWDALKQAHIWPSTKETDAHGSQITLDTQIEVDGSNLSVGERSLLSIARALVKDAKVVILDEATASVDLETDKKIQETIARFDGKTLLCVAHRLRTILNFDKILVLDEGKVAEFDTPLNLFMNTQGIFRGLCEKSDISLEDFETTSRG